MKNEEKILEATLAVVREQTISGTRMHLIAQKADMLQSNLHYYYKTKNDLLQALQDKVLDKCLEIRTNLRVDCEDSLESELDVFIKQKKAFIMEYRDYDYAELDFWVQGRINPKMRENFAKSFDGWRMEIGEMLDRYVPSLNETVRTYLPYLVVSYLEGATIQYLIEEDSFDLDAYFAFGKKMILDTIHKSI